MVAPASTRAVGSMFAVGSMVASMIPGRWTRLLGGDERGALVEPPPRLAGVTGDVVALHNFAGGEVPAGAGFARGGARRAHKVLPGTSDSALRTEQW